jgi:predicted Zn-dependent protease
MSVIRNRRHSIISRFRASGGDISSRIVIVLFLLALSGSRSARGQAPVEAAVPSVAEKARQLAGAGETVQAIQILQAELELHPAELEPRLTLASIYLSQGDRPGAEREFREALTRHPRSDRAALALSEFYLGSGSWSDAQHVLADLLHSHPQLREARWQMTLALAGDHRYAEAARNLSLVPVPPAPAEQVRYYRTAASIHSGLGEKKPAARDMEKALLATPGDQQLQLLTALTEADASDWSDCAQKLGPLFQSHPTAKIGLLLLRAELETQQDFGPSLEALRNLPVPSSQALELALRSAELLAGADRHKEAAEEFALAYALSGSDANIAYNLAVERYAAGEIGPALEGLNSLRQNGDSAEVEDLIADMEDQRGDSAAGIRDHENAVRLAPSEERYRLALGTALLRTHAFGRAQAVFEKAIQAFPNSARSYVGLALAEYMTEQYEASASAFLRADELDDHSGRMLNYLGSTQMESPSGPSPAAIDALCQRAEAHARDPVSAKWCGALLFRKNYLAGDQQGSEGAIRRLRAATVLAPNDAAAYCFLGRALFWKGNLAEARHSLETCVRMQPESSEEHYRLSLVYQELNLRDAAAQQSALSESLKEKAARQSPIADPPALEVLDGPSRPTLHKESGQTPASPAPRNQQFRITDK